MLLAIPWVDLSLAYKFKDILFGEFILSIVAHMPFFKSLLLCLQKEIAEGMLII